MKRDTSTPGEITHHECGLVEKGYDYTEEEFLDIGSIDEKKWPKLSADGHLPLD